MSLYQFNEFCGSIRDQTKFGQVKWEMWPKQKEVADAFDKYRRCWVFKSRTMGLSEEAGELAFKIAVSEPNSDIIVVSQKLPDAEYFLGRRIGDKIEYAYKLKMSGSQKFPWPTVDIRDKKISFGNGSKIEALSSESNSARSRTNRLVILDEFREFSPADGEEILSAIQGSFMIQPRGQLIVISTPLPGSYFNQVTEDILRGKLQGWKFITLFNDADPQRTPEWLDKKLSEYVGSEVGFWRENPRNIADGFASKEGLVWSAFDEGKHVKPVPIRGRYKFLIGYDHGRDHPAVMLFCLYDKYEGHLYVFDELFCRNMELPEVAMEIRKKINHYRTVHGLTRYTAVADRQIFAKDGRKTVAEILWRLTGIMFRPSIKRNRDGTIDGVNLMFANMQITIAPKCEETIEQIKNWRWKPGGKKMERPEDKEDDAPDILMYLYAELHEVPIKKKEKIDIHFNREFNEHRKELQAKYRELIQGTSVGATGYTKDELEAWQAL